MKTFIITLAAIVLAGFSALAQTGAVKGKITDASTGDSLPFVNVMLLERDSIVSGAASDFDGYYRINDVVAGIYRIRASYIGYETITLDSLVIVAHSVLNQDIRMKASAQRLESYDVVAYGNQQMSYATTVSGVTVSSRAIRSSPKGDVKIEHSYLYDDSGLLTASELNDFSKWSLWTDIRENDLKAMKKLWKINPEKRYMVQVTTENGNPVIDATAVLKSPEGKVIWMARTDNTGKAELWNGFSGYMEKRPEISVIYNGEEYRYKDPYPYPEGINALSLPVACEVPDNVEIAFVVDATGSMDDEITFLQSDLLEIIDKIGLSFPEIEMRVGSVFYRCIGNSYTTTSSALSGDISQTTRFIARQSAGEGGAEAVEEAMATAVDSLGWSDHARSRIMFLVLDEQPLTKDEIIAKVKSYTIKAAEMGIRIVPVVASAETMENAASLEYLMRSIALTTNGSYVFLTDHSNIGNEHAKPVTDKYEVELLNSLLKRLIYQYCYVPECDKDESIATAADTVFVSSKKVVAVEVLDSLRTKDETTPRTYTEIFHLNLEEEPDSLSVSDSTNQTDNEVIKDRDDEASMKIYPNPTSGKFKVRIEGKIEELFLFDLSGKLIARYKPDGENETEIDISSFSTGIYFLKFQSAEKWYSGKVILER